MESSIPPSPDTLHQTLESYPWHTDPEFQSGLHAILGPSSSTSTSTSTSTAASPNDDPQTHDLTLRARCFYYARKYAVQVDFEAYRAWRSTQPASALSSLAPATLQPRHASSDGSSAPSSAENTPSKAAAGPGSSTANGSRANPTQPQPVQDHSQTQDQALPAYPPSFATIMELIKSGQPIPGIKDIPDTVLVGQATEATKDRRKKPWEERLGSDGLNSALSEQGTYGGYFGAT